MTTGAISGKVTRAEDGTALAGVQVQAIQSGNLIASASTAADGTYRFNSLSAGTYNVEARYTGYATLTRQAISVSVNATTTVDFVMVVPTLTTYAYDETTSTYSKGRLTTVTEPTGDKTTFKYDRRGNITETAKAIDNGNCGTGVNCYTIQRAYDSLNRVTTLTYPKVNNEPVPEVISYTYDLAGNLKTVSGSATYVTDIQYNKFGQRTSMAIGNGMSTTYDYYDSTAEGPTSFRLRQICTIAPGSPACDQTGAVLRQKLTYGYDSVGNVMSITDAVTAANSQSFAYDHLKRLTVASSSAYGTLNYAYNPIGNMTSNPQVGSYTYPTSGASSVRPHAVTQAGGYSYHYDANGNMVCNSRMGACSAASPNIRYDVENRPTGMTVGSATTTMSYDYSGERVKKTENGGTTTYIGGLVECTASGCARYYFAGSKRIALKDALNQVYYYHTDHLGSSTVVTYGSGPVTDPVGPPNTGDVYQQLAYYPYGGTRTNSLGTASGVKHKFTGQEIDDSTGLYYMKARFYDPVLGRFIQPDPVGVHFTNPQTLNRYSYVLNNPLKYVDPTGNDACQYDAGGTLVCGLGGTLTITPAPVDPHPFRDDPADAFRDQAFIYEQDDPFRQGWGARTAENFPEPLRDQPELAVREDRGWFQRFNDYLSGPAEDWANIYKAEVDPSTIQVKSSTLFFDVRTTNIPRGRSIDAFFETGRLPEEDLSGNRSPNFRQWGSGVSGVVRYSNDVLTGIASFQQPVGGLAEGLYLRFGPSPSQHPNNFPNPFITGFSNDCPTYCGYAFQYGFGPSGQ